MIREGIRLSPRRKSLVKRSSKTGHGLNQASQCSLVRSNDIQSDIRNWVEREATWEFSRSGGPGGQNVNKTSTRATLRLPVEKLPVDEDTLERVRLKLANRITLEGDLLIHSRETRSQAANRRVAAERAVVLLLDAIARKRKRKSTRPSRRSVERRIESKKVHGRRKRNRRPPDVD